MKTGHGALRSTYSVVLPSTISMMRLWPYAPMKSRSWSRSLMKLAMRSGALPVSQLELGARVE